MSPTLHFPSNFSEKSFYVVELCELDIGRRLLVRPEDAIDSQWCVEKMIPVLGRDLTTWSQSPRESEHHPNLLVSGTGFYVIGDEWLLEDEWDDLIRVRV